MARTQSSATSARFTHGRDTDLLKMSAPRLETTVGPDQRGRRPFRSFRKEKSPFCSSRSWSN